MYVSATYPSHDENPWLNIGLVYSEAKVNTDEKCSKEYNETGFEALAEDTVKLYKKDDSIRNDVIVKKDIKKIREKYMKIVEQHLNGQTDEQKLDKLIEEITGKFELATIYSEIA